ncbi:Aspartate/glutamate racemase [Lentibacillus halodurans]|uniref:Aspartate/glutamate racemase n=1 Tax=Lentibacillus halodurans TaxID=237679 RepID=A0A1I1AEE0_9BACI|nr:aspartate/glutamate racemase family protein [Lentibacillus halodurans]SFB36327.1 Aspartate/glutamate racemase [Lentibacillus halodurans]
MKIGVIHATCNAVPPLNEAFKQTLPDVTLLNFVNENIQYYANQNDGIDDRLYRDFARITFAAQDAGVDAIIVACTVLTPYVNVMKPFISVPILAVDQPMLENAAKNFRKVGVVATNAPSIPATKAQIEKLAKDFANEIEVDTEVSTQAFTELKGGNETEHNRLNCEAAAKLKERGCEAIVLAQITQASAKSETETLGLPVLTSPGEAVKAVSQTIEGNQPIDN